jgi:hypothetical protein
VNEDGLPIIEITEPLSGDEPTSLSKTPNNQHHANLTEEPPLSPLSSMAVTDRERLRAQRDRILDILEEEERAYDAHEKAREEQERRDALERRKKEANVEFDRLRAQREMQKKMGKALLKNMADVREREERTRSEQEKAEQSEREKARANPLKPRKSVSFAELPKGTTGNHDVPFDGAVKKISELGAGLTPTMKINVVERFPSKMISTPGTPIDKSAFERAEPDSDDESVSDSAASIDFSEGKIIQVEPAPDLDPVEHLPDSSSEGDDEEIDSGNEVEEFDPDFGQAAHHREIALAYYQKRGTIGIEAHRVMTSHTHNREEGSDSENPWDRPVSYPRVVLVVVTVFHLFTGSATGSNYGIATSKTSNLALQGRSLS